MDIKEITEIDFKQLISQYKGPLYVYDENILEKNIEQLKKNFKNFDVFYSFKANPNKYICNFVRKSGCFADTASIEEVRIAYDCGFDMNNIIYSSPGKKEDEIMYAIDKCIIIADSINEIAKIDSICKKLNITTNIGIRINPNYSMEEGAALETMSGVSSKFGIDEEFFYEKPNFLDKFTNVNFTGIQIYMGSQITNSNILYENFNNILKIAKKLYNKLNLIPEFIDFGGGFGVKYTQNDNELNIIETGKMVDKLIKSEEYSFLNKTRLIIESGRFICAESGFYVAEILDIKTSRGKKYVIIDGGMNTFFRPVFIKENKYPVYVVKNKSEKQYENVTIAGVMCTPIDILDENVYLPNSEIGDIIVFSNTGAYGYTMSLTKFISHKESKEIYISKDKKIFL